MVGRGEYNVVISSVADIVSAVEKVATVGSVVTVEVESISVELIVGVVKIVERVLP